MSQSTRQRGKDFVKRIMETATTVFAEEGFAGARMDEIARRAGANKALIYYHIGDKASLYSAILKETLQRNTSLLEKAVRDKKNAKDKLRAFIETAGEIVSSNPHLPRLILREAAAGGNNLPDETVKNMARIYSLVREILREGESRKEFRAASSLVTHFSLMGAIMFLSASSPIGKRIAVITGGNFPGSITEAASQLADLVLDGLKIPPQEENNGETISEGRNE